MSAGPRDAGRRREHLVGLDLRAVVEHDRDLAVARDARRLRQKPHIDAALLEPDAHLVGCERLLAFDQAVAAVHERHLRAVRAPGLAQLHSDDATAEDGESRRHLLRRRRLDVRPRARLVQPFDVGDQRRRARRHDHRLPGDELLVADGDALLAGEPSVAAHEGDVVVVEPRHLGRVVLHVDHLVAPREDRRHVDRTSSSPGTRATSRASSTGRRSAFEGMHA